MPSLTVILNPYSGRGKGRQIRPALEAALRNAGLEFELLETSGKGHAIELTLAAKARGAEVILSVGGDGTINEVVNGLVRATTDSAIAGRLAILPIGTGIDFAMTLGQRPIASFARNVQPRLDQLAHAIRQGKQRLIDVGWGRVQSANTTIERYFDNSMAAGLEAQSGIYSNRISGLPGRAIYTLAAIQAIATYSAPDVQLRWNAPDGSPSRLDQRSLMISIGNSHRTGGGFLITPDAKLDDGQFDVAVVRAQSRPALLALLPRAMVGKHTTHPAVTMLRTDEIEIISSEGLPVHMDGEIIAECATHITARILPAKLVIVEA